MEKGDKWEVWQILLGSVLPSTLSFCLLWTLISRPLPGQAIEVTRLDTGVVYVVESVPQPSLYLVKRTDVKNGLMLFFTYEKGIVLQQGGRFMRKGEDIVLIQPEKTTQ